MPVTDSISKPVPDWWLFRGADAPHDWTLPEAPPWRRFARDLEPVVYKVPSAREAKGYQVDPATVDVVNTALLLRRPLLVTGAPGVGKSSLAHAIAWELGLGRVLTWAINTRSTLLDGLYRYDAIGRLQDAALRKDDPTRPVPPQSKYLKLGPLGTALLATERQRVLLIDEIDKSDVDLPNDLLNVLEGGEFEIPELSRLSADGEEARVRPYDSEESVPTAQGVVRCREFPVVILTSNAEREFPPAFLRRCLRLDLPVATPELLARIVRARLEPELAKLGEAGEAEVVDRLVRWFDARRKEGMLSTDQLMNLVFLSLRKVIDDARLDDEANKNIRDNVLRPLAR